jgi:hypothetical protein
LGTTNATTRYRNASGTTPVRIITIVAMRTQEVEAGTRHAAEDAGAPGRCGAVEVSVQRSGVVLLLFQPRRTKPLRRVGRQALGYPPTTWPEIHLPLGRPRCAAMMLR